MVPRASFLLVLALVTAGLLGLAAPSATADASVELTATSVGGRPAFVQGGTVNPTFTFAPGEAVTMTVAFEGFHNLHVEAPVDEATPSRSSGSEALTFTIPEDFTGDVTYVCDVHPSTMRGTIRVAASADQDDGNATAANETTDDGEDDAASDPVGDATLVELTALFEDGALFFRDANGSRNPTLRFAPGEDVLVRLDVQGTHNIHIGAPVDARTDVQSGGNTTLAFSVPADFTGTIEYWCEPHRDAGMTGAIVVGDAAAEDEDASTTEDDGSADADDATDDASTDGGDATARPPPAGDDASAPTPAPGVVAALAVAAGAAVLRARAVRGR